MQLLIQTFSGEVKGQWWQHNSKTHQFSTERICLTLSDLPEALWNLQ